MHFYGVRIARKAMYFTVGHREKKWGNAPRDPRGAVGKRSASSNSATQHAGLMLMLPCGRPATTTLQRFYILPVFRVSCQLSSVQRSTPSLRFSRTVSVTRTSSDKTPLSSARSIAASIQLSVLTLSPLQALPFSLFKFSSTFNPYKTFSSCESLR